MKKFMAAIGLAALTLSPLSAATEIVGYVSDAQCAKDGASKSKAMEWIKPAAFEACVKKCVDGGSPAVFVTEDNKMLTFDKASAAKVAAFHGRKVKVTGTITGATLAIDTIAGLKLERSSFTGTEFLPNIRVAWRLADQMLLWGAVSRSVRTPSRIDRNLILPGFLVGGTFNSEEVIALEAGYRGQPTANTSLSISFFYNIYDGLRTTEPDPLTFLPLRLANGLKGHSYGLEAWASHQVAAWWRLSAGVSRLKGALGL